MMTEPNVNLIKYGQVFSSEASLKRFESRVQDTSLVDISGFISNVIDVHANPEIGRFPLDIDTAQALSDRLASANITIATIDKAAELLLSYYNWRVRNSDSLGNRGEISASLKTYTEVLKREKAKIETEETLNDGEKDTPIDVSQWNRTYSQLASHLHFYDFPQIALENDPEAVKVVNKLKEVLTSYLSATSQKSEVKGKLDKIFEGSQERINKEQHSNYEYGSSEDLDGFDRFEGDKETAKLIMDQILFGISEGYEEKIVGERPSNEKMKEPPKLVVYFGKDVEKVSVFYQHSNNVVVVGKKYLENLSNFSQLEGFSKDALLAFRHPESGELLHESTLSDFARLTGIEEGNHARFTQYMESRHPYVNSSTMTLAEYDSSDEEYSALLAQLNIAKNSGMHSRTINQLQSRILNAEGIRKRR